MLILYVFGGGAPSAHGYQGPCICSVGTLLYMQDITDDDHTWQLIYGCHSVVYMTRTSRIYLQMMDLTCIQIVVSL